MATGAAIAASEPPPSDPPADSAAPNPAPSRSPPVPLNSGVSHEFDVDTSKITMEVLPDGTRVYHMNGQGMQAVTAHLGADGKVELKCTDKAEQAAAPAQTTAEKANVHEQ